MLRQSEAFCRNLVTLQPSLHCSVTTSEAQLCGASLECSPFQPPNVTESRLMPTIALVDDDRNILTSVSIALEAEGYRVKTYTDGASALDGFRSAAARSCHPRHQDAAHGRHGAAAPAAPEVRPAGDLPDLQGRRDRRAVRPQDGRRRLHPQAVLAAPAGRAGQGGAAPRPAPKDPTAAPKEPTRKALERGLLRMDQERHTCTWKGEPVTLTVTEFLILQALAPASRRRQEPRRADGRGL